jgi:hypothetical protein
MKKMLLVAVLLAALTGAGWAQVVPFADFEASFQDFADGVANSLPISASIGLNWSHAYIGQFPHFGVGVSVGGMFLPYETMEPIVTALGAGTTIPEELKTYGIPFPTIAAGARLGGFGLPFDMGFKFAIIPEEAKELFSQNVTADYFLIGGDVRLPVIKGKGLIPTLSIGGGYTFVRGQIGITDVSTGETIDLTAEMMPYLGGTFHELIFTDPDLVFNWDTHMIEAKAQASWNLFILTPSIGIGAAYGISNAGGGLSSSIVYNTNSGASFSDLQDALASAGYAVPSASGLEVMSEANGWSFWVFGGTAINLFFVKIDLSAMYNFLNGDYGGSVNVRVQL